MLSVLGVLDARTVPGSLALMDRAGQVTASGTSENTDPAKFAVEVFLMSKFGEVPGDVVSGTVASVVI